MGYLIENNYRRLKYLVAKGAISKAEAFDIVTDFEKTTDQMNFYHKKVRKNSKREITESNHTALNINKPP